MRTLALLIALSACQPSGGLHRVCPSECYGFGSDLREARLSASKGVGLCKVGKPVCDSDFNVIDCKGQVLPVWDICDGLDNNCDGIVDDSYRTVPYPAPFFHSDTENPCGPMHGECRNSQVVCNGGWVCKHAPTVEFGDETLCDGLDNDCDGRADEDIIFACTDLLGNPSPCTCFEGPIEMSYTRPCAAGAYECVNGETICVGQIFPTPEVCDGIDNDCNGVTDDTLEILDTDYDIVFAVDDSGSMGPYHAAVAAALDAYSSQFVGNPHYRFALVDVTDWARDPDAPLPDMAYVKLLADFGDFSTLQNELLQLDASGSAYESTLDAPYWVCEESNALGLSWRPEAQRLIFEFTDEAPQAYSPHTAVTYQTVADACIENKVKVYIWATPPTTSYDAICQETGGIRFLIHSDWQAMFDDLNTIIQDLCVDGT